MKISRVSSSSLSGIFLSAVNQLQNASTILVKIKFVMISTFSELLSG
ncbi:MAG: hypothetical protein KIG91_03275 [Treponema sp.]|nr:hypothetical protein [Treponema sp.]